MKELHDVFEIEPSNSSLSWITATYTTTAGTWTVSSARGTSDTTIYIDNLTYEKRV